MQVASPDGQAPNEELLFFETVTLPQYKKDPLDNYIKEPFLYNQNVVYTP